MYKPINISFIGLYTTTANTLFSFQVYKVCSDMFDSYDQHYGRGLVKDTIKDGMTVCVLCVSVCICVCV